MLAHSFWDGGLFLAGLALVRGLCAAPVLAGFRWLEAVSVLNQGWVYSAAHAWNPVLFQLGGHPITLVPQLIWLAAPVVYYLLVLRFVRRARASDARQ